jgi:hypothetical protein
LGFEQVVCIFAGLLFLRIQGLVASRDEAMKAYLRMLSNTSNNKTEATKNTIKMKTVWSFWGEFSLDVSAEGGGGNLSLDFKFRMADCTTT